MGAASNGKRFTCLDCSDGDLCNDCHASWKKSDEEMKWCRGHVFYELPRPCWYGFKEGIVMENGATLPEVIGLLEVKFRNLLKDST